MAIKHLNLFSHGIYFLSSLFAQSTKQYACSAIDELTMTAMTVIVEAKWRADFWCLENRKNA